jgi:cytochrome c oxidase assembly protein subunit 15
VDVSQYRLAAHLTVAVVLYAAFVWTALGAGAPRGVAKPHGTAGFVMVLVAALLLQIAAGGFVAGLDAGHASDTWPLMNGALVPDGLGVMQPWWKNLFENALTVQFDHRLLAYAILVAALVHAVRAQQPSAWTVVVALLAQISLGILTVVWAVPLSVALVHQGGALVVLAVLLVHLHRQFTPV